MARFKFTMRDGNEIEFDQRDIMLEDRIAFERQFHMSSVVLGVRQGRALRYQQEVALLREEAESAGEEADIPDPPDDLYPPEEWMVFFGWRQALDEFRGLVPSKFDVFLKAVADYEIEDDDEPEADLGETGAPDVEGGVDDETLGAVVELTGGSGLDPTGPARRPTSRRSSSPAASPTRRSG